MRLYIYHSSLNCFNDPIGHRIMVKQDNKNNVIQRFLREHIIS